MIFLMPDVPKPPGSQPLSSPQKGKQLRVPKPTPRYGFLLLYLIFFLFVDVA